MTTVVRLAHAISAGLIIVFVLAAAVSVVVGGVGIMNILLASVEQRTREIGVRMSVGARRRDILGQFLFEALALGMAGSSIGVLVGLGLPYLSRLFVRGVEIHVSVLSAVLAFRLFLRGGGGVRRRAGIPRFEPEPCGGASL